MYYVWRYSIFLLELFFKKRKCVDPNVNATLTTCKKIFESLNACNSRFLDHAMLSANPFYVCTDNETSRDYRWTMGYYEQLAKFTIAKIKCSDEYLSRNRMELVIKSIEYSKGIWNDANCDNCYEPQTINENPRLSKETRDFFEKNDDYQACLKNVSNPNDHNATCQSCVRHYMSLNEAYETIKDAFGYYKMCFDIQDQVSSKFGYLRNLMNHIWYLIHHFYFRWIRRVCNGPERSDVATRNKPTWQLFMLLSLDSSFYSLDFI